jgi:3-deoxy-D-manno-octulosonic-acid transferase
VLPRLLYSFLLMLLAPLAWVWLSWRARATKHAWHLWAAERFGRYPQPWDRAPPVWVHATSVGEVRAAKPLIKALLLQGQTVLLTHFTPTGRAEAARLLAQEINDAQVWLQWVPYDFEGAMRRFWRQFKPQLVILMEREVWPNLVAVASANATPVVLASARLSQKSQNQSKWIDRLFGGLMHDAYSQISVALAQSESDAQRLFDVGVPQVQVCGNLKFDLDLPEVAIDAGRHWRQQLARPVVAIASTREGEDKIMVPLIEQCIKQYSASSSNPSPLFFLIPRHPQRFDEAARHLDAAGCRYARWSVLRQDPNSATCLPQLDVILGDTMGEMPFFYAAADIAIVGGSFERHGGQNFIEPCAIGTAVIVGPYVHNFAQAVQSALQAQAIIQAVDAHAAFAQVARWLEDPGSAKDIAGRSQAWVTSHIGATERMLQAINELQAHPR